MDIPSIKDHSGNKYIRKVYSAIEPGKFVEADVYEILDAYNVSCPAIAHACKKLLCTGIRGKASKVQDLKEAIDALYRAVQKEEVRNDKSITFTVAYESNAGDLLDTLSSGLQKLKEESQTIVGDCIEKSTNEDIRPSYEVKRVTENGNKILWFDVVEGTRVVRRFEILDEGDKYTNITVAKKQAEDYANDLNWTKNHATYVEERESNKTWWFKELESVDNKLCRFDIMVGPTKYSSLLTEKSKREQTRNRAKAMVDERNAKLKKESTSV